MTLPIQIKRLDRLSALLQALAPRVSLEVPNAAQVHSLRVYLVTGPGQSSVCSGAHDQSRAPNSVVILADHSPDLPKAVEGATVCLHVSLEGPVASLLMREFAQPLVVLLAEADTALIHAVQLVSSELSTPRCGQPAMLASAGDILFIGLLRHLVAHPQASSGLFAGLADARIAAALVAMHERPQAHWALESLAAQAGMSRTTFATRFKDAMNTPPGKYLTQLRLQIAQRAVESGKGLKAAARESGYRDVSALSRALRRARQPARSHAQQ